MGKKGLIFASILAFISCSPTPKEFDDALKTGIANAEKLVNNYDPVVLDALEKNRTDSIPLLSEKVLADLAKEHAYIKNLAVSQDGEQLKKAAEDYIGALIKFVKSQDQYAGFSNSLTPNEIKKMDNACSDALMTVKLLRTKLTDYQKAFAKDKGI